MFGSVWLSVSASLAFVNFIMIVIVFAIDRGLPTLFVLKHGNVCGRKCVDAKPMH